MQKKVRKIREAHLEELGEIVYFFPCLFYVIEIYLTK
uniref:Uncharacterized protein n=1 Tax=Rhizophora mucronata TaxID=61149 RepID=A0A2P2PUV6_RHIMU